MSSMKKGFKAPVLTTTESDGEKTVNSEASEKDNAKKQFQEKKGKNTGNAAGPSKPKKFKKENKPGEKSIKNQEIAKKEKKSKKLEISLTDSQYEEIFKSVLDNVKSYPDSQNNTPGQEVCKGKIGGKTPVKQKGDNLNGPNNSLSEDKDLLATPKNKKPQETDSETPKSQHKSLSQTSVWGSHFRKNQVSSLLKDFQESQKSLVASSNLLSPETTCSSDNEEEAGVLLSQNSVRQCSQVSGFGSQNPIAAPVITTDQRTRLEHLQICRNVGLWVFCCRPSCQKQRYLASVTDPQDVPELWYCHMNPETRTYLLGTKLDPKYNHCQAEEQKMTEEEEEDMIYNEFTAGSVVWARVAGYPWWPALVDDDPDLEQYYWLEEDMKTVTHYHVVFFDEVTVTRAWVNLKNIASYFRNENKYKTTMARGLDYRRRIAVAKEQANDAVTLTTAMRLKIYSFIARYKGVITTSAAEVKRTMAKYKLKVKVPKKPRSRVNSSPTKETKSSKRKIANELRSKEDANLIVKDQQKNIRKDSVSNENEETLKAKMVVVNNKNDDSLKRKQKEDSDSEICLPVKKIIPKSIFEKKIEKLMKKRKPRSEHKKVSPKEKTNLEEGMEKESKKTDLKTSDSISPDKNFKLIQILQENNIITVEKDKTIEKEKCESTLTYDKSPSAKSNQSKMSDDLKGRSLKVSSVEESFDEASKETSVENSLFVDTSKAHLNVHTDVNPQKEPQPQPSTSALAGSETPSGMAELSSTNLYDKINKQYQLGNTEDSFGSFIEPSQAQVVMEIERDELQEEKHSQSTIADFMVNLSEDAVVPEAPLSQLSEPFEE